MQTSRIRHPLYACLILALAGCGGSGNYKLAPVSGKVILDGKPLPGATVRFEPIEVPRGSEGMGVISAGMTNEQGEFRLTTVMGDRGAVVGTHRVMVSTMKVEPEKDVLYDDTEEVVEVSVPELVPTQYQGQDSTLRFTVPAGGTSDAELDLGSS